MKKLPLNHPGLLRLLGSRIYYRLAFLVLNIVLFYRWAPEVYGSYGAKMGTWSVLQPLLAVGIGKCALKLLTIHEKLRAWLLRELVKAALWLTLLMNGIVLAFNLIWGAIFRAPFDHLDVLIGFYSTLGGCSLALQSLGRGLNEDFHDYGVSLILGTAALVLALAVAMKPMAPMVLVILLICLYLGVNGRSLYQLLKAFPTHGRLGNKGRRAITVRVWRETMVMGMNSLIGNATFSVVSIAFRYYQLFEAAGHFNIVMSVGSFGLAFFEYLLRLVLPRAAAMAYRGKGNATGGISNRIIGGSFVVMVLSMAASFLIFLAIPHRVPYLFFLWIALAPVFLLNELMIFWFEASSHKKLMHTLYASLVGLLVCTLLIFATLPWGKAPGALLALGISEVAASLYLVLTVHRHPSGQSSLESMEDNGYGEDNRKIPSQG